MYHSFIYMKKSSFQVTKSYLKKKNLYSLCYLSKQKNLKIWKYGHLLHLPARLGYICLDF